MRYKCHFDKIARQKKINTSCWLKFDYKKSFETCNLNVLGVH